MAKEEFKYMFGDCEVSTMPRFGNLYSMDTYVANRLTKDEHICFKVGTHQELKQVAHKDYEKVLHPKVVAYYSDRH